MRNVKILFNKKDKNELLKNVLDVRKFEIELYWKRATYFWAFIAVIFAGYFNITVSEKMGSEKIEMQFLLSCVGFIFSLAWYFVNRGSKFWQENWEAHAAALEDELIGPLFKTTLEPTPGKKFITDPFGRFSFSVSRLNIVLSLFVTLIWVFIIIKTVNVYFHNQEFFEGYNLWIIGFLTVVCMFTLGFGGRSSKKTDVVNVFIKRTPQNKVKDALLPSENEW